MLTDIEITDKRFIVIIPHFSNCRCLKIRFINRGIHDIDLEIGLFESVFVIVIIHSSSSQAFKLNAGSCVIFRHV